MLTVEALFAQPDNQPVLRHLQLWSPADVTSFRPGVDASPYDEGGQIFFDRYGRRVPAAARCSLGVVNLLVHPRTARIFALHAGRFTVAVRRGRTPHDPDELCGWTADGVVDLRALGPGWALFCGDDEEAEGEAFWRAHELAGR